MGVSRLEDMRVVGSPVPALRKIAPAGDSLLSPGLVAGADHQIVVRVHLADIPDDDQDIDDRLGVADLGHGRAADMMDVKQLVPENGSQQDLLLPVPFKPLFRPGNKFGSSHMNTPFRLATFGRNPANQYMPQSSETDSMITPVGAIPGLANIRQAWAAGLNITPLRPSRNAPTKRQALLRKTIARMKTGTNSARRSP